VRLHQDSKLSLVFLWKSRPVIVAEPSAVHKNVTGQRYEFEETISGPYGKLPKPG
jgi:hypothetical protein